VKVTPLEVRQQEFRRGVRGYDVHEVRTFLEMVADELESLSRDRTALTERVRELDAKVDDYRRMEKTLQDTLTSAQRAGDEIRKNAQNEAELVLRDARLDAENQLQELRERRNVLRTEITALVDQKDAFLAQMGSILEAQQRMIQMFQRAGKDKGVEEIVKPVEVSD
jgi:cell division initiation protein